MVKLLYRLFPAPYCSGSLLALSSIFTALVMVYTLSDESIVHDIFSYPYLILFLCTLGLTFTLFLILGHLSHALDKTLPYEAGREVRLFRQLFYGVLCLGGLAFGLVMISYAWLLGVDLDAKKYMEHDLIFVMGALLVVNMVHKSIYWRLKAQS